MKKKSSLIVLTIMLNMLSMHAAESPTSYRDLAHQKAKEQFNESFSRVQGCFRGNCTKKEALNAVYDLGIAVKNIAKGKALQQFNESLTRVKHCFQGKCTKMEAAKVARDLGIAVTIVIAQLYIIGGIVKKHAHYTTGEYMQKPGATVIKHLVQKPGRKIYKKVGRLINPLQPGDLVIYTIKDRFTKGGDQWTVSKYPEKGKVEIWQYHPDFRGNKYYKNVPVKEVTLEK